MGYRESTAVEDHAAAEVTGAPFMLLKTMAEHVDERGLFFGSVTNLARSNRVNRATVQRQIRVLERAGELTRLAAADIPAGVTFNRPDRQPFVYRIMAVQRALQAERTGPQSAAPPDATGPQSAAPPDATGPQIRSHGAADCTDGAANTQSRGRNLRPHLNLKKIKQDSEQDQSARCAESPDKAGTRPRSESGTTRPAAATDSLYEGRDRVADAPHGLTSKPSHWAWHCWNRYQALEEDRRQSRERNLRSAQALATLELMEAEA